MCGRFTLRTPAGLIIEQFQVGLPFELRPRYNIAPTQSIVAIRCPPQASARSAGWLRWGLIPSWAKDPSIGSRLINARSETVPEKPAFRAAFQRRRCLIPADGYFEWRKAGKTKQPFYIRMADERPFAFAGLWESWREGEGAPVETCSVITTESNELTRPLHDRMPVILDTADYDLWLDPAVDDRARRTALFRPYDSTRMRYDPVSTHVNHVKHDDPECVVVQRHLF